jgi:FeS assembly SUF system protein
MPITKEDILSKISEIYDPEISINIVELGLIYDIAISDENRVDVTMTLTSAWCPSANEIPEWVEMACMSVDGVRSVRVEVVFDPPWGPDRISDAGKLELGLF